MMPTSCLILFKSKLLLVYNDGELVFLSKRGIHYILFKEYKTFSSSFTSSSSLSLYICRYHGVVSDDVAMHLIFPWNISMGSKMIYYIIIGNKL